MKKSILNLEGVQVLSRNEQKNVNGGLAEGSTKGCKLVMPNGNGGYTTYSGTCSYTYSLEWMDTGTNSGAFYPVQTGSFCNIGNGVSYPLSSNGGVSNC